MAYMIINVRKRSLVKENGHFPLSPKAFLVWFGFTDEGSITSVDSDGVVRLCPQTDKGLWYPVINLRADVSIETCW